MAQIRKTTYLCDACGAEVQKKELRTLQFVPKTGAGYDYNRAVRTELCDPCEEKAIAAIVEFVKEDDRETVRAYRRKAEA